MRLLAALCLLPLSLLAEGTQGWYQHNLWVRLDEQWSVGNYLDLRLEDDDALAPMLDESWIGTTGHWQDSSSGLRYRFHSYIRP